jgi:hypothetical protein
MFTNYTTRLKNTFKIIAISAFKNTKGVGYHSFKNDAEIECCLYVTWIV